MAACEIEDCANEATFRAYASYNADSGENVHPLHARYPAPMIRACVEHIGDCIFEDSDLPGSTRQWLVVIPRPREGAQ